MFKNVILERGPLSFVLRQEYLAILLITSLDIALGKNGECCSILKLEASSTGNSSFIQQKFMGLYFRYPQIRLNEYQAFSHEGYDGALMMDKRPDGKLRGWRQIRTQCDEDCPEDCRNEKSWEYYNKDSDNEDKMWHKDGTMKIICVDENYEKLSTSEANYDISKGGNLVINQSAFKGEVAYCEITTPSKEKLYYTRNPLGTERQSLQNGRIQLSNISDSECKVEVLNPNVVLDQGVWNFMIIQGSNAQARWYLHRVTVNFIEKDGIMLTTLASNGTNALQVPYIAVGVLIAVLVVIAVSNAPVIPTYNSDQEDHTTSWKKDKECDPSNMVNAKDYDVQKPDNRIRIISMPTPSNFERVSRDSFY